RGQQVQERASDAINRPRHDDIELAPASILQHLVEAGTLVAALGAADASILIARNHLPAPPLRNGLQLAPLVLHGLILVGADPHVDRGAPDRLAHGSLTRLPDPYKYRAVSVLSITAFPGEEIRPSRELLRDRLSVRAETAGQRRQRVIVQSRSR